MPLYSCQDLPTDARDDAHASYLDSEAADPNTYSPCELVAHRRRIGEAHLPRLPTGWPHRAPTCDPAPPHPVSLRTRTTPRAPLTVVISDRSPMSLTLGVVSVDHIRDREERKSPHAIDLLIRGLLP